VKGDGFAGREWVRKRAVTRFVEAAEFDVVRHSVQCDEVTDRMGVQADCPSCVYCLEGVRRQGSDERHFFSEVDLWRVELRRESKLANDLDYALATVHGQFDPRIGCVHTRPRVTTLGRGVLQVCDFDADCSRLRFRRRLGEFSDALRRQTPVGVRADGGGDRARGEARQYAGNGRVHGGVAKPVHRFGV